MFDGFVRRRPQNRESSECFGSAGAYYRQYVGTSGNRLQSYLRVGYCVPVMDTNAKPTETVVVSDPDEELTSALERVRRSYGGDIAAFFESIRRKREDQPSLFDPEDNDSTYPKAALARCTKK